MTRNEQEYYANINGIEKALDRIANALENNVTQTTKDIPGFEGTLDALDGLTIKSNDQANEDVLEEYDTKNDELHELVQDLDNERYHEFCNIHCLPSNDAVAVSNYIADLDYDEVLGIIKEIEAANEDDLLISKSDDNYETDLQGNRVDSDHDIRVTAKMYIAELNSGDFKTKKDCILDYITNEFGLQGARYTDIIKFAYYLSDPNSPKFGYNDRGYYSQAISGRKAHLTQGGNDFLVKGINNDGLERYFALSFVENATGFWKYIK